MTRLGDLLVMEGADEERDGDGVGLRAMRSGGGESWGQMMRAGRSKWRVLDEGRGECMMGGGYMMAYDGCAGVKEELDEAEGVRES